MERTAVKIDIIDKDTGNVNDTVQFWQSEVAESRDWSETRHRIQEAQDGTPTLFLQGNAWQRVKLRIRLRYLETVNKLTTLYNAAKAGHWFRVYPHYLEDSSLYFHCLLSPNQVPRAIGAWGYRKAGEMVEMTFREKDKNYPVMDGDIVV